jgi:hypothetical protein
MEQKEKPSRNASEVILSPLWTEKSKILEL